MSTLRRIDELCDEFEASWRAGQRPSISEFLIRAADSDRTQLLRELVASDIAFRKQAGESVTETDYQALGTDAIASAREVLRQHSDVACRTTDAAQAFSAEMDDWLRDLNNDEFSLPATVETAEQTWRSGYEPMAGYVLVRRLGKGGFGEVWEAQGPGGMPVALKRVNLQRQCGSEELTALDLLKCVRHPHLLSIHGYWIIDGTLIIGSELADGSLADHSPTNEPIQSNPIHPNPEHSDAALSNETIVSYLTDAAEALDYLARPIHRVNNEVVRIQHRDVKPANLLVQGGAVKVGDFGLAKALKDVLENSTHSMTIAYAPPEFFQGQTTAGSDQYSLAVSYYQLRTGRLPFSGNLAQIAEGHLRREPDLTGLDEHERQIVLRALAKNPDQRWAGCVKFIGEIRRIRERDSMENSAATERGVASDVREPTIRGVSVTSGQLLANTELAPFPLEHTQVRAVISAAVAEVRLIQTFRNTFELAVEAVYVFPLPDDAAVNAMLISVGDRIIEGVVREREEARATYEEAPGCRSWGSSGRGSDTKSIHHIRGQHPAGTGNPNRDYLPSATAIR